MKACEGRIGRVFVIRLKDGDVVPQCIERFAEEKGVSVGRAGQTMTGCLRHGVTTWLVGEIILYEILDADVVRMKDKQSGFELLELGVSQ